MISPQWDKPSVYRASVFYPAYMAPYTELILLRPPVVNDAAAPSQQYTESYRCGAHSTKK